MPLARYFLFVGGVLLALLFVADAYIPKLPDAVRADTDRPAIRIHSDRKWPERVVFDTSHPVIVPAQTAAVVPVPATVADALAKAHVREAFAQLRPSDLQPQASEQKQAQSSVAKKPELKPHQRKIAKRRAAPPMVLVAQQPQFGFFANSTW